MLTRDAIYKFEVIQHSHACCCYWATIMVQAKSLERLAKAREIDVGCPWELPEYQEMQSCNTPMLNWSGDAWDAARAYLDAVKAIEQAIERLGTEVAICQNVGANGTAHALLETREILAAALPQ